MRAVRSARPVRLGWQCIGLPVACLLLDAVALVAGQGGVISFNQYAAHGLYTGDGTFYGQQPGANLDGACAYGTNLASTYNFPWSVFNSSTTTTFIALDQPLFASSGACGTCMWYRATGPGIGVQSQRITTDWQYGAVDNECPECLTGSIDLARNGDGRWSIEWYPVPCQVGSTNLHYFIRPTSDQYFLQIVVSNGRVPVAAVEMLLGSTWIALQRSTNNMWTLNSPGYQLPMPIRITPSCGNPVRLFWSPDTVTDTMPTSTGYGSVQFALDGCTDLGPPWGGLSTPETVAAPTPTPTPLPTPTPVPTPVPTGGGSAFVAKWPYVTAFFCSVHVKGTGSLGGLSLASLFCSSKSGAMLPVEVGWPLYNYFQAHPTEAAGVTFIAPHGSSLKFGPDNNDVGLRFTGSSVTLSGSLSEVVNVAAAPLSVYKASSASFSGLHFLNNQVTAGMACSVISGVSYVGVTGTFVGNSATQNGGCIQAVRSRLNIKSNSLFQSNSGSKGAIYAITGSSFTITSSRFLNNTSNSGGAVTLMGCGAKAKTSTITQSVFSGNRASIGNGGAVRSQSCPALAVSDTAFVSNVAEQNGAALYISNCGSTVGTLAGCTFTGNSAAADDSVAVHNCAAPTVE